MVGFHIFSCYAEHKIVRTSHLVAFHDLWEIGYFTDISQSVFTMVWEKRATSIDGGRIAHYLSRTAKLKSLDFLRMEQGRRQHLNEILKDVKKSSRANLTEDGTSLK